MNEIEIISDGSCDLSDKDKKDNNIIVVPFYVSFDGKEYKKEGEDISVKEFYQKMVDNKGLYPKSSLPSVNDYLDVFKKCINNHKDIICMCITTKFSGSYNSAMSAKELCLEEYPDAKITVINTMVNTVLQGLLVKETARMRKDGLSYEEIISNVERIKETGRILFTISGIEYLRHGGRIGKLKGLIGSLLRIQPLIVLENGEISNNGFGLSRMRSLLKLKDMVAKYFNSLKAKAKDFLFCIGYGYDYEEAVEYRKKIALVFDVTEDLIPLEQIGAAIGVHTGPHPLGVCLIKKYNA